MANRKIFTADELNLIPEFGMFDVLTPLSELKSPAKELEEKRGTRVSVEEFQKLGGRYTPAIDLNDITADQLEEFVEVEPKANIYTVCESGENRSELGRIFFKSLAQEKNYDWKCDNPSHGAIAGMDPYICVDDAKILGREKDRGGLCPTNERIDRKNPLAPYFPHLPEEETRRKSKAGCIAIMDAIERRGESLYDGLEVNEEHVKIARQHMDKNYFSRMMKEKEEKKVVIVCFTKRTTTVMSNRLVENAKQNGSTCENMEIYTFEVKDPFLIGANVNELLLKLKKVFRVKQPKVELKAEPTTSTISSGNRPIITSNEEAKTLLVSSASEAPPSNNPNSIDTIPNGAPNLFAPGNNQRLDVINGKSGNITHAPSKTM